MPQETNLNVSPYFDDFDQDKNFYKVLFKPGYPIQARELTTLQSILQNQVEQYGKHIFRDGSVVIPGQLKYESPFYAVEIEPDFNGIPISIYFDSLIGKRIRGSSSGVTAEIVYTLKNSDSERGYYTIYVKYIQSGGSDFTNKRFEDAETILLESLLTYNGFTIQAGQGFCNTKSINAVSNGSAVSVSEGIYFIRGFFVKVQSQTILLDQYTEDPSYKVGFNIIESVVTSDEDESLYDNAQGFSNYAAPGADRFRIELELAKHEINSEDIPSFVEILRVENGSLQFLNKNPQYNLIREELARRTADTSGDYFVNPFSLAIRDSLNDRVLSQGLYFKDQLTVQGNNPSDDLMVYEIGPGKAYVNGYEVETISSRILDVPKTRTTSTVNNDVISFNCGVFAIVNNVYGSPKVGLGTTVSVKLMSDRIGINSEQKSGTEVGSARIYDFIPESNYTNKSSRFEVRLFDIDTYSTINLTQTTTISRPAVIKGKRSNAVGYLKDNVSNSKVLTLYSVSGDFLTGEPITVNDSDTTLFISSITDYNLSDIKSIYADKIGISTFNADLAFDSRSFIARPGTTFNINNGVVSAGLENNFKNIIKVGDIVSYSSTTFIGDPIYNKVTAVSVGGTTFTISGIATVSGVCNGRLQSGSFNVTNVYKLNNSFSSLDSSLITPLNRKNVSSISVSEAEILQRRLFSSQTVNSDGTITITIPASDVDVYFEAFDEDRFLITYNDGSIEFLRGDKFNRSSNAKSITFYGLSKTSGTADVLATVVNRKPNSKVKKLNKTNVLVVSNSKSTSSGIGTTTLNDGLTYSNVYGTRIQDQEICLNVPDIVRVLAVYESSTTNDPELPYLQLTSFTGPNNNNQDYIIGEQITGSSSGAVALIVERNGFDKLNYVYLNDSTFQTGETISGGDSKTVSLIINMSMGDENITQNFILDDGQREHFYDYGRIIRKSNIEEPTRKLKIVFQNYTIDSGDSGEFITVNSYSTDGFKYDIPSFNGLRLSDVIDIRPRVSPYVLSSSSPFEFSSRNFSSDGQYSRYTIAPGEDLSCNYSYYQGRIDLIILNSDGTFEVVQGNPSDNPIAPARKSNSLDIAYTYIPPYVFDVGSIGYKMVEHKRYRMSDIALLEDRIDRVEQYTTLSMLESSTEKFTIRDSDTGLDRFKCGFFADNFSNHNYHDISNPNFRSAIDQSTNTLRPPHYTTSLDLQLGSEAISGVGQTYSPNVAHSFVSDLGSPGVKKTGDLVTLNYDEVQYFEQRFATKSESVTPFLVKYWSGSIVLRPSSDTWVANGPASPNSNTAVNREVSVDPPRSQTSLTADTFDWIANAVNAVNELALRDPNVTVLRSPIGRDIRVFFRDGFQVTINPNAIVASGRFTTQTSDNVFNLLNRIVPQDAANQFRNQVTSNRGTTALTTLAFNSAIVRPSNTSIQSISNQSTFLTPPPITQPPAPPAQPEPIRTLRSRNIEFDVNGLRPVTRFYPFFQSIDVGRYVTPKLLEIQMNSGRFQVGETVESDPTFTGGRFRFRVCSPNHKFGPFNAPTETYSIIPYNQQSPPSSYTESSTYVNVDTNSLQLPSETYSGLAVNGMRLVGRSSGARATVSNIRLVSDNSGRLVGSLFIPDPDVATNPRWTNGQNTFTLMDTPTLSPTTQQITESSAEAPFSSSGTVVIPSNSTRNPSVVPPATATLPPITNNSTTNFSVVTTRESRDPLAQSFYVTDVNGIFLTSAEIFFETKDESIPVTLQIRPLINGVPSNVVVPFSEVTLTPDRINTSTNGSVATRFTFPSPVYLNGPVQREVRQAPIASEQTSEYAIVLLSNSPNYRVFISELGASDLIERNVRVSEQPTLGSLFKSQNGSIWTPSQLEDLKYRLYRANFTNQGLVRFFNPLLTIQNEKVTVTGENQFVTLSKKIIVGLGSTGYSSSSIIPGITLIQNNASGKLTGIAGSISVGSGVTISTSGVGYTGNTFTGISLLTESGYGSGAVATINIDSSTTGIGTVSITNGGSGYQVGDSLLIPKIGNGVGYGAKVNVTSIGSSNAFIIDNVQGNFTVGLTTLSYINNLGITTIVGAGVTIISKTDDSYYTGTHIKVYQENHAMHSISNYVKISKFRPTITETNSRTISNITIQSTSIPLTPGTGVGFTQFEGVQVSSSNPGYILIGNEVIGYTNVVNDTLTSSLSLRGIDSTQVQSYDSGTLLYKYELQGVSLRRINKVHKLSLVDQNTHPSDLNHYHINIEMSNTDYDGVGIGSNRSNDLYFKKTTQTGGTGTNITNNIQFETLTPNIGHKIFPTTSISPRIRTFTGTSIGGSEESFVDCGFEEIALNRSHFFDFPRIICSEINESKLINDSPGNRSFTFEMLMSTEDSRISPIIDLEQTSVFLTSNLINNPIGINTDSGYANSNFVRSLTADKHSAIYLSKPLRLAIRANSIKVILSASITNESDIRVLYQTFRNDSPNSGQNYNFFPGWSNYSVDGQGIKRVIDNSQSNGSPDSKIIKTQDSSFKDYEFSVDDLADFDAFAIKIVMSSTNQANPPLIKDLRAIATVKPRTTVN